MTNKPSYFCKKKLLIQSRGMRKNGDLAPFVFMDIQFKVVGRIILPDPACRVIGFYLIKKDIPHLVALTAVLDFTDHFVFGHIGSSSLYRVFLIVYTITSRSPP